MLKSKKLISLLLTGMLALGSVSSVFAATDYTKLDDYKTEGQSFSDDFDAEDSTIDTTNKVWQFTGATANLVKEDTNQVAEIRFGEIENTTKDKNNIVRFGKFVKRQGIVVYQFDVKLSTTKLTKGMNFALRTTGEDTGQAYNDRPLFTLTAPGSGNGNGQIRKALDISNDYTSKGDVAVNEWYTFRIEVDTETGMFYVSYGKQGGELTDISSKINSDYYKNNTNPFTSGVAYVSIVKDCNNNADKDKTAMYIDNVKIDAYQKAYAKINALDNAQADQVEAILTAYDNSGMVDISDIYFSLPDKTAINRTLVETELTSEADINTIIMGRLAEYENPIYVDLTELYNADFIGKAGDTVTADEKGVYSSFGIGLNRSVWLNDNSHRDNYTGQGYDGAKISPKMTADGVLTATNDCNDSKSFKIPTAALSAGAKDAVTVNSDTKEATSAFSDGSASYITSKELRKNIPLSGKKLSAIDVAAMGGVPNLAYLGAVINYADGTKEDVFLDTANVPSSGQAKSTLYKTENFGAMIIPNETGVLADDSRTEFTEQTTDNSTKSYMTVMEIPADSSKNVNSVDLYVRSKYGSSSIAVFGITEVPSTTEALIKNVNAAKDITVETAMDNKETVIKAYSSMRELIERGFYSESDKTVAEITALYNVLESESTEYIVDVDTVLTDGNGEKVDKLANAKKLTATATCTNGTTVAKTAIMTAAFYDKDGNMISVKCSEKETATALIGTATLEIKELAIPENTETVKLLVWDSLDSIKPVREQTVIVK